MLSTEKNHEELRANAESKSGYSDLTQSDGHNEDKSSILADLPRSRSVSTTENTIASTKGAQLGYGQPLVYQPCHSLFEMSTVERISDIEMFKSSLLAYRKEKSKLWVSYMSW